MFVNVDAVAAEVVVVLEPGGTGEASVSGEVTETAHSLGCDLRPLHPAATDPDLARYLVAEAADEAAGHELVAALISCVGVEGAYIKPAAEPPGSHS